MYISLFEECYIEGFIEGYIKGYIIGFIEGYIKCMLLMEGIILDNRQLDIERFLPKMDIKV